MKITIVAAVGKNLELGFNNQLPWHLPADLKHFKQLTSGGFVVMGRKSYQSIGRPLPNRTNIVITQNTLLAIDGCVVVNSPQQAINCAQSKNATQLFVIGGAEIYRLFLPVSTDLWLTHIEGTFNADTFFPDYLPYGFRLENQTQRPADETNKYNLTFAHYIRAHH